MTLVGWCPGGRTVPDMLGRYPGTRVVRIFVGPGDPLPAWDGPVLGPLVAQGVVIHLSFKTNTVAEVQALVTRKPAGVLLLLTYAHEPEQQTYGDPTVDVFHARWGELVPAFDGHPMRPEILLGPVYTRYWWQRNAGDLRWLLQVPVDFIGWDVYNSGVTYRTPDDLLTIPRQIAARTGLPYLLAELGATRLAIDFDGAERSAWMRAMVAAARGDGALTACWYHREMYDLTRADSVPEQQTWQALIQEDPMPTYAQLQAEPWWGREVVTPAMDWLGDELCRRTGRPREAAGTKGDRYHLRGAHRSQEWIQRSVYCTNRSYTVQSGLTADQLRHVAGFDFTPGSADQMIAQCKRLLAAMKAGQLDEVREFYGNVDGDQVVDGWDNVRDRAASSDSSHLWHWHLSIDRRHCNNQALMERILRIALGEPEEIDMEQSDKLERATSYTGHTVGHVLADLSNLRDFLLCAPGQYTGPSAPAAGSVVAMLAAMAKAWPVFAGRDFTDEQQIIAGLLGAFTPEALGAAMQSAGFTPEAFAAAIPPEMAQQVADVLAGRLAS